MLINTGSWLWVPWVVISLTLVTVGHRYKSNMIQHVYLPATGQTVPGETIPSTQCQSWCLGASRVRLLKIQLTSDTTQEPKGSEGCANLDSYKFWGSPSIAHRQHVGSFECTCLWESPSAFQQIPCCQWSAQAFVANVFGFRLMEERERHENCI